MKIKKRGKTVTIKFENVRESTQLLRGFGFQNIPDLQTRVAEQRDEAADVGHTCPACGGDGIQNSGVRGQRKCIACDGTGRARWRIALLGLSEGE